MNLENNQVVCGCFNITVGDLKEAIAKGAKSYQEVQEFTSVGKGCKRCNTGVENIVVELLK